MATEENKVTTDATPEATPAPKAAKADKKAKASFVSDDILSATFGVNTSANYLYFNSLGHAFFTEEAAEVSTAALENKKVQRIENPLKP